MPLIAAYTHDNTSALYVKSDGKVGIGTATPAYMLDVQGTGHIGGNTSIDNNLAVGTSAGGGALSINAGLVGAYGYANNTIVNGDNVKALTVQRPVSGGTTADKFVVYGNGNTVIYGKLQIGNVTTPKGYSLYVDSGIIAERYKCALKSTGDWSDYVFDAGYRLKPLSEVAAYIKTNKHLPDVPSAEDVVREGIDMAKMDAKLLQKIEELTLYTLELKKEIDALKSCK